MKKPLIKKGKDPLRKNVTKNLKEIINIINEALRTYKREKNDSGNFIENKGLDISEFKKPVMNKKRNGSNQKLCDGLKVYSVLAKEITDYCWVDIGFQAGEREHSTMLWHFRQYESLYSTDKAFRAMADYCRVKAEGIFNSRIVKRESVVDKCNSLIEQLPINTLQQLYTEYNP